MADRKAELDQAVQELHTLESANPQDADAIARQNAKVDELRKATEQPEQPVQPVRPATSKKF